MEKIWLEHYPKGMPVAINPNQYQSLADLFNQSVVQFGDRPAVMSLGMTLTYKQLAQYSTAFAAYLQQSLKLQKGERIALMMPNLAQYLVALYGAFKAGLIVVNVNPLYTERELIHQLNDAAPQVIVVLENFASTLEKALPHIPSLQHVIITKLGDLQTLPKSLVVNFAAKKIKKVVPEYRISQAVNFSKALTQGKKLQLSPVELTQQDLAFLQYTGGTTGVSKAAMLSHGNLVANVEQAYAWIGLHFKPGYERAGVILPLYHIFSLVANALVMLRAGSCCCMVPNPRDMDSVVEAFRNYRFTALMIVNTLANTLLGRKAFKELDFSELHMVIAGGMALQEAVANRWLAVTKTPVLEGFGLTEASPITCINPLDRTDYNGSIGLPVSSTDVMVVDEMDQELPLGEIGELCFKGPQVMQGYWQRPEESARVLLAGGWLKTGDIGRIDEKGYVYIVDRKKDMIDVAGFNVYPNEVEGVIAHHAGVKEVAVVGVPHSVTGELVKAYIVKRDEALTKADLIAFCKKQLVSYKIPKRIEFCQELPKNTVGKVLRRMLRTRAEA